MASELSKFFEEISSEKSKFAEKVKNDTDLQSMFGQIAELKKESDKRKRYWYRWKKTEKRGQNFFGQLRVDGKDLRNGLQLTIGLTYQ